MKLIWWGLVWKPLHFQPGRNLLSRFDLNKCRVGFLFCWVFSPSFFSYAKWTLLEKLRAARLWKNISAVILFERENMEPKILLIGLCCTICYTSIYSISEWFFFDLKPFLKFELCWKNSELLNYANEFELRYHLRGKTLIPNSCCVIWPVFVTPLVTHRFIHVIFYLEHFLKFELCWRNSKLPS